jgi:GNAT superfamily N-acetyltransferase/catechol 2,3-dioxygenase-like lactoylglutathione lyase family enzyme
MSSAAADRPDHEIRIEAYDQSHRQWARQVLLEAWGSSIIITRGRAHEAAELPGFVAVLGENRVGLVTYHLDPPACELVSVNSLQPGRGIGRALVRAVHRAAQEAGCERLWLITTNDNMRAMRFYQRLGFSLVTVHRRAIEATRRLKPQISAAGHDGIPIRDEVELELLLGAPGRTQILGLHHANITMPSGGEDTGRRFYGTVMGLREIKKPESLRANGGLWFQLAGHELHISIEDGPDRAALRAHLAYQVIGLPRWRERLARHGVQVYEATPIPGFDRLYIRDPFGNRIELIESILEQDPDPA